MRFNRLITLVFLTAMLMAAPRAEAQNYGYLGMKNYATARVELHPLGREGDENLLDGSADHSVSFTTFSFGLGRMITKRTALQLTYGRSSVSTVGDLEVDFTGDRADFDYEAQVTNLTAELKVGFKNMSGPLGWYYSILVSRSSIGERTVELGGTINDEHIVEGVSAYAVGMGGGTRYVIADRLLLELGIIIAIPLPYDDGDKFPIDVGEPLRQYQSSALYRPFIGVGVMF